MNCPHANEYDTCEDCPDFPCDVLRDAERDAEPTSEPATGTAHGPKVWSYENCAGCPMLRLVASFIRSAEAEEAWATGDSDGDWHTMMVV